MFENTIDKLTECFSALTAESGDESGPDIKELESRVCFSAVPVVGELVGAEAVTGQVAEVVVDAPTAALQDADDFREHGEIAGTADESLELIFIDSGVADVDELVDEFVQLGIDPSQVFLLDAGLDGLEQVTDILNGFNDVSAVHIISHGEAGAFQLGGVEINNENLADYTAQLTSWQSALSADADLLLYGCNLASSSPAAWS